MHVPRAFRAEESDVRALLENIGAADLVTMTPEGLVGSYLPFHFRPDAGEHGTLVAHLGRGNGHWRLPVEGEALVVVHGPDAYVSPSWYAAKREHHRVVPTWNHVTAHVHGRLRIHDDPEWVEAQLRELTARHEAESAAPWSVDDAPRRFVEGQLKAVVGLEVVISRVEATVKMSQNRPDADVPGIVTGLARRGHRTAAAAVRAARRERS